MNDATLIDDCWFYVEEQIKWLYIVKKKNMFIYIIEVTQVVLLNYFADYRYYQYDDILSTLTIYN